MSQRRSDKASVSTLQLVGGVALLVLILIGFVSVFAPERAIAPPPSEITYEAPPAEKPARRDVAEPEGAQDVPTVIAKVEEQVEEEVVEDETADPAFLITGTVRDSRSGEALGGALVVAHRQWTSDEKSAWNLENVAAVESGDSTRMGELLTEKRALTLRRNAKAGVDGSYSIKIFTAGEYVLKGNLTNYIAIEGRSVFLDEETRKIVADVKMSRGATISGRVKERGTSVGVANVIVTTKFTDATTDEDGYYTLSGLTPGEYEVSLNLKRVAYKPGPVLPFQRVTLRNPDEERRNVDFSLEPAGLVWGYVLTPDRKPISRASVILGGMQSVVSQAINAVMRETPPITDQSDDEGYYELIGVPLNQEMQVYATSEEHAPQLADPFVLTVRHRTAHIDIFMFPGTNIYGRVTDTHGAPVEDAEVVILPSYQELFSPLDTPQAVRRSDTKEDGTFVLKEIPDGNYQIMAMAEGFKYSAIGQPIFPDGFHDIKGVHLILDAIGDGERSIFGTVKDSGGAAIAGAELRLMGISTDVLGPVSDETTTNNQGEFIFAGLDAGTYQLSVSAAGYASVMVTRARLDEETNVIMEAASRVSGRVLIRETNQPPTQYTVSATLLPDENSPSFGLENIMAGISSESFSAPDGSFSLELRAGYYQLEAEATDHAPGRTTIALMPGQELSGIMLYVSERGGRIAGRVQTSDGGNPQGAVVSLAESNISPEFFSSLAGLGSGNQTQVGEDGEFVFEKLAAGEYVVTADHERYTPVTYGPIALQEGGNTSGIVLRLSKGGTVEGYVYRGGVVVAGAIVTLDVLGRPYLATTDHAGFYRIENVPPGEQRIRLTLTGIGGAFNADSRVDEVQVRDGQTTQHNFGEGGLTTIVGRLSDPPPDFGQFPGGAVFLGAPGAGLPGYGEMISLPIAMEMMTQFDITSTMDSSGEFMLFDVKPGEWQLSFLFLDGFTSYSVVHTQLVTITGEEEEHVLGDIEIN